MSVGLLAGSSRALRLDPFALPVRYKTNDAGADARERVVEVHRERVVMRRAVRGMRMEVSTPITAYLGVTLRVIAPEGDFDGAVAIFLEHRDPGLSVPVFVATDGSEVGTEWRTWARVLGLPPLIADADGTLRDPFAGLGRVWATEAEPRRRGYATMHRRRGTIRFRRRSGLERDLAVYRDELEIIARD
jgi:hypothetical protein